MNPENEGSEWSEAPWNAQKRAATASDYISWENMGLLLIARCGFDLVCSGTNTFEGPTKKIGREKPWSGICELFFDETNQAKELAAMKKKIINDPTRLLDVVITEVNNAETVGEVVLFLLNCQASLVDGELKRKIMVSCWNCIRVTQLLAERLCWSLGAYYITRPDGQRLMYNWGYPFVQEKSCVLDDVLDASGDGFVVRFAYANFTKGKYGSPGQLVFEPKSNNKFSYLFVDAHFEAEVRTTADGLCVADCLTIRSTGQDLFQMQRKIGTLQKELIVLNTKIYPREPQTWKLTLEICYIGGKRVAVAVPYNKWLEPNSRFVVEKTVPSSLRGYKFCYSNRWFLKSRMFQSKMEGTSVPPMDGCMTLANMYQRTKRLICVKTEPINEE